MPSSDIKNPDNNELIDAAINYLKRLMNGKVRETVEVRNGEDELISFTSRKVIPNTQTTLRLNLINERIKSQ